MILIWNQEPSFAFLGSFGFGNSTNGFLSWFCFCGGWRSFSTVAYRFTTVFVDLFGSIFVLVLLLLIRNVMVCLGMVIFARSVELGDWSVSIWIGFLLCSGNGMNELPFLWVCYFYFILFKMEVFIVQWFVWKCGRFSYSVFNLKCVFGGWRAAGWGVEEI